MLFKTITQERCEKYITLAKSDLHKFVVKPDTSNVKSMIKSVKILEDTLEDLNGYVIPKAEFNVTKLIERMFEPKLAEYKKELDALDAEYAKRIEVAKTQTMESNEKSVKEANDTILPLVNKHNELMSYSENFKSIMRKYNIMPAEMYIDEDLTQEEIMALLESSINVCKKYAGKSLKVERLFNFLNTEDPRLSIIYTLLVILLVFITLPFMGIAYVTMTIIRTGKMYKDLDSLKITSSLMCDMDFSKYIPEHETIELDTTEIDEEFKKKREELESKNPQIELDKEIQEAVCQESIDYVVAACKNVESQVENVVNKLKEMLSVDLAKVKEKLNKIKADSKNLGDVISESNVLSTRMILGKLIDGINTTVDFGLTNINFLDPYSNDLVNVIKLMFCNMLLNVCAKNIEVVIVDPVNMGREFAEFLTPTVMKYMKVVTSDVTLLYDEMRERETESIRICRNRNIQEYNKEAEKIGLLPKTYYLYIVLSGLPDKFHNDKIMSEFLTHSANYGVIVWTVYNQQLNGCKNIKLPINVEGTILKYNYDMGMKVMNTFESGVNNKRINALDYRKAYLDKYLPADRWFTQNSIKGINIRPGLVDGDPSKPFTHSFCDSEVHFLLGGATGAGKSVAIDCMLQSMIHEYAPDELQIIYIDMKNVEVSKYTKDEYSLIPHAIILAGTTDGEYCLSVFDWAFEEMIRRGALCSKYGVQKVEDLRKKYDNPKLPDYNPEVHVPRIVLLVDEFQVLFDASRLSSRIIDKISQRIESMVRLARAAGIHLWFTSQDMSGTVSKKVLDNFSLRGALRCTKEVSSQLLGNEASGSIKDKVGWMYTNNSAGQDATANKMWKVPYAPGDDLHKGVIEVGEKCKKEGRLILRTKFYDEKISRTEEDLKAVYKQYPQFEDGRLFVLGDRTVYSDNVKPANFRLMNDTNENILHVAFERQDMMNVANTLIKNIVWSSDTKLLINCSDKDTITLMDLESYMPKGWEDFLYPEYATEDIIADIEELINDRADIPKEEHTPMYVMCVNWEKRVGVGRDENYRVVEALNNLIFEANKVNIHFIFCGQSASLPSSVINVCNHRLIAKVDERTAMRITSESSVMKYPMPVGEDACFCLYQYGTTLAKFKIYRFKYTAKLESREI